MNIKPSDNFVIPLCIIGFLIAMFTALSFAEDNLWLTFLILVVAYPLAYKIHLMLERDLEQYKREYRNDR